KNKALKPGTVLLEILYLSKDVAPRAMQLGRYLPPAALLCLLYANGNDLASRDGFETLNEQLESVPRGSANKFVQAQREVLSKQFAQAETKVAPAHQARVDQAKHKLQSELDEELARMTALQAVNPSVRDSEIQALRDL